MDDKKRLNAQENTILRLRLEISELLRKASPAGGGPEARQEHDRQTALAYSQAGERPGYRAVSEGGAGE